MKKQEKKNEKKLKRVRHSDIEEKLIFYRFYLLTVGTEKEEEGRDGGHAEGRGS